MDVTVKAHLRILESVAAGDPEGAAASMDAHLRAVLRDLGLQAKATRHCSPKWDSKVPGSGGLYLDFQIDACWIGLRCGQNQKNPITPQDIQLDMADHVGRASSQEVPGFVPGPDLCTVVKDPHRLRSVIRPSMFETEIDPNPTCPRGTPETCAIHRCTGLLPMFTHSR